MLRSNPSTDLLEDEDGSAAIEFVFVGLILLVPIVYLVIALAAVQSQTLGVEAAARHTARAISLATDEREAAERSDAVLSSVVTQYGMDPNAVDVVLACSDAGVCPRAGATVSVTVRARVPLPFVPPVFGLDRVAAVPVEATSAQRVSRFWSGG